MKPVICRNAGELIKALAEFEAGATVFASEPPFTGIKLVPQSNGKLLIASLYDTEEGRAYRDAKAA